MSTALVIGVTVLALAAPPRQAPSTTADTVILRDGQVALGQIVEPAPRGKVVLLVRRRWAQSQLPEWAKRWETAEAAWVKRARHERRERLIAWRKERTPQAARGDAILAWLDSEIDRLADDAHVAPSPLMAVQLGRADVRTVARRAPDLGRLLRLGWQAGFDDVEIMPIDELKQALEGRGFAIRGSDTVGLEDLLPIMPEADAHWQLRRAATEVANDSGLRFIRFQSLVLPEGGNAAQLDGAMLISTLKDILGDKPASDPLESALRDVGAKGRAGAVVTRLELAPDFSSVAVETTLWVQQTRDQWVPAVSRSASVRPDALGPDAGKPLAADPQVKAALGIVDALGLGQVSPELKERSLNMGAATQQALGIARAALDRDLDTLELSLNPRPTPEPKVAPAP
jgi:hypothetical protein